MFGFYGTEKRNESDGGLLKPHVIIHMYMYTCIHVYIHIYWKVLVYYLSQHDL